ncbi:MAG TPA: T9SS type A sorting domain-containing protein, partial [Bacteroidetes bacterium]|nr:T9SS type A sorting domain-containing protein [Bacteroidota bacterium]
GDNTTSQDTSPVHTYMADGTYEVCLTVGNINSENTFCRTLELGTVTSSEEAAQVDITVFPNPCREGVNIIIGDYLPKAGKVVLYDVAGQRHKVQPLQTGWNTLRLDGLRAGVYFYEIWENGPECSGGAVLLRSGKLVKARP